jgi:hypothetical protein
MKQGVRDGRDTRDRKGEPSDPRRLHRNLHSRAIRIHYRLRRRPLGAPEQDRGPGAKGLGDLQG